METSLTNTTATKTNLANNIITIDNESEDLRYDFSISAHENHYSTCIEDTFDIPLIR